MGDYLPEFIVVGDDSGDNVIVMQCSTESPVFIVNVGSLRKEDLVEIAPSFQAWLESGLSLPDEREYRIPLVADIYVDQVKDLKTMFALRKLLAQSWGALQMKEYLASQPFVGVRSGHPIAVERMLQRQPDLKPYLFFGSPGQLRQISP
jgi:hypothetical protein